LNAAEFALERPVMSEVLAIDDFDGAIRAQGIAGQPDFTIAATANFADQRVVGM